MSHGTGTTGIVMDFSKHHNPAGDMILIGYLKLDSSQLRDDQIPLAIVGPVTFLDIDMGLVQTPTALYRLGVHRFRSKSELRRLTQQLSA